VVKPAERLDQTVVAASPQKTARLDHGGTVARIDLDRRPNWMLDRGAGRWIIEADSSKGDGVRLNRPAPPG